MGKQQAQTLLISLGLTLVSALFAFLTKLITSALFVILDEQQVSKMMPYISFALGGLVVIIIIVMLLIAFQLGWKSFPAKSVKERNPPKHFKLWQRIIGLPLIWSQFRLTIVTGILVVLIIMIHAIRTVFSIEHGVLIFIAFVSVFIQFYAQTGDVRNTLDRTLSQMLYSLGQQIDFTLREALGETLFHVRIRILLYDSKDQKLYIRYHYGMDGEPDLELRVGANQGVIGRVFSAEQPRPLLQFPYGPRDLGFSQEQLDKMPQNIKWKMGLPLLNDHKPFGVLAIDADTVLAPEWLDKILDYVHASASAISVVMSLFPDEEIQRAF